MKTNRTINNKLVYELTENESFSLDTSSRELKYIKDKFKASFNFTSGKKETILKGKNIVGVIKTGSTTYRIYPKVGHVLNIFNMIHKVSMCNNDKIGSAGYLYLDPKIIIDVDEGVALTNELILILLSEIDKVSRIGYTKNYNTKNDNINFLRGKLDIKKQINKNIIGTKFYCKFNELSYYTNENIILFKTIDKVLNSYNLTKDLRSRLLFHKNQLLSLLDIDIVKNINIQKINFSKNRVNAHYETLIAISKMILQNKFTSSLKVGTSTFCNFMVKTDLLFEQYLFVLLKELIDEDYTKYEIAYQKTIDSIKKLEKNSFNTIDKYLEMDADIVIKNKISKKPTLIIDTKYIDIYNKNKLQNYAYYQMISYLAGLAIEIDTNESLSAILLAHGDYGNSYKVPYTDKNLYIFTEGINILSEEDQLKEQLKTLLNKFLIV